MAKRFYEKDGNLDYSEGQDGRHYRLRQPGPCACAEPARFRRRRGRRPVPAAARAGRRRKPPGCKVMTAAEAAKAADVIMILVPDHIQARSLRQGDRAAHDRRQDADVRARLQHSLRAASSRRPMSMSRMIAPKAPGHRVRELFTEGVGRSGAGRRPSGCVRQGARERAGLCAGARLPEGRRDRNHLPRRDRKRSLRRAGRALRRRQRTDPRRFRDAGRSRLCARNRLLRVPARTEADRRSHLRRRPQLHALLGLRHGRVRRLHARPAHRQRADARRDEEDSGGDPVRRVRHATGSRRTRPAAQKFLAMREAAQNQTRSKRSARSCAR